MTTLPSKLRTAGRHVTPFLVLQVLLAGALLNAGIPKLAGEAATVDTFDQVGLGQWFRYVIGAIEIAGGIGLLFAPVAGLAALAAGSVLVGAVTMELFVLTDGNATVPAILAALLALVAWHHRARTTTLMTRVIRN
jgi:putative oxidoreductase